MIRSEWGRKNIGDIDDAEIISSRRIGLLLWVDAAMACEADQRKKNVVALVLEVRRDSWAKTCRWEHVSLLLPVLTSVGEHQSLHQ